MVENGISPRPTYRPLTGYALRQAVSARVHVWQEQDIPTTVASRPAMPAMVALITLLLASDGFDGFCLIDQLSGLNVGTLRVMGPEILPMPVWGFFCCGLISLWIGYKTHPRRPQWRQNLWFRGRPRRLCRVGIFCFAALACVAGHVSLVSIIH
ncbi:hypothetical protein GOB86_12070 [Acetobacter lambici]|uniref:hypothetical protein n=1 Tax=Acetobacter lambici TaxID=1332824 RepID=UPI00140ABEA0|nr:hypothetical protein [Acetobacter lambici]NHO57779.1 hypothetical protein [Acetobacter lambici]